MEQKHIADAFVFELSKVDRVDIRERMVGEPAQRRRGSRTAGRRRPRARAAPGEAEPAVEPCTDLPSRRR